MSSNALPEREEDWIPSSKITDYLLSTVHPLGRSKSAFFLGQGYQASKPDVLALDLMRVAQDGELIDTITSETGQKHIMEGLVIAPNGDLLIIRSVWIIEPGDRPRFVTAYPA